MVASTEFANFLRDQLAPLGYITMRRMFGKTGVFCEGVMFGMVTENHPLSPSRQPKPGNLQGSRVISFSQLCEERPHYRPFILACAGPVV